MEQLPPSAPAPEQRDEASAATSAGAPGTPPPAGIRPDSAAAALDSFRAAGDEGERALRDRQQDPNRQNPEQH